MPSGEELGRFFRAYNARFERCLEPTMCCQQAAIRAHSIQNARVIDLLEEKNHVIALRPDFSGGAPDVEFKSIGRNNASTFTGLCAEHDQSLFAPIDKRELDPKDREQMFLLAYRSVTRELHAVMEAAAKIQGAYLSRVERGLDPKDQPSEAGLMATQQMLTSFETYTYRQENYDKTLIARNFDDIKHDIIEIEQLPTIAVSALFSLDQILNKNNDDIVRVVLNVLPTNTAKTLAIFSYSINDRSKARAALDRIFRSSGFHQKYELSKCILESVENFIVSPRHFEKWSADKKTRIRKAFTSTVMTRTTLADDAELMLF